VRQPVGYGRYTSRKEIHHRDAAWPNQSYQKQSLVVLMPPIFVGVALCVFVASGMAVAVGSPPLYVATRTLSTASYETPWRNDSATCSVFKSRRVLLIREPCNFCLFPVLACLESLPFCWRALEPWQVAEPPLPWRPTRLAARTSDHPL